MRDSLKRLIEQAGGTVLMDGTLIQFGEESFEFIFRQIYEAGLDQAAHICVDYAKHTNREEAFACAALIHNFIEQPDMESESSGGSYGQH
jgi:hypothetical protein